MNTNYTQHNCDLAHNNNAILSMDFDDETIYAYYSATTDDHTTNTLSASYQDYQDDLYNSNQSYDYQEPECQFFNNNSPIPSTSFAFEVEDIMEFADELFHGLEDFLTDAPAAANEVVSPACSPLITSSRRESKFDKSSFASKVERRKRRPRSAPVIPTAVAPTVDNANFKRLSGRGTYIRLNNANTTAATTIQFNVFSKPTDGKGTKIGNNPLIRRGEVSVECAIANNNNNNPTVVADTCYINMKVPGNAKKSIFELSTLKEHLNIPRGHEVWICFQDSTEFFNIYCQKGKQANHFEVHNMITFDNDHISNTEQVETLSRYSPKSITPSNVTFTPFQL